MTRKYFSKQWPLNWGMIYMQRERKSPKCLVHEQNYASDHCDSMHRRLLLQRVKLMEPLLSTDSVVSYKTNHDSEWIHHPQIQEIIYERLSFAFIRLGIILR